LEHYLTAPAIQSHKKACSSSSSSSSNGAAGPGWKPQMAMVASCVVLARNSMSDDWILQNNQKISKFSEFQRSSGNDDDNDNEDQDTTEITNTIDTTDTKDFSKRRSAAGRKPLNNKR